MEGVVAVVGPASVVTVQESVVSAVSVAIEVPAQSALRGWVSLSPTGTSTVNETSIAPLLYQPFEPFGTAGVTFGVTVAAADAVPGTNTEANAIAAATKAAARGGWVKRRMAAL